MIKTEQLREIVFSHYSQFIKFSKTSFPSIHRQGISHDELVNEAIVNIFDVKAGFETENNVLDFITKAIKAAGYHERECLKDGNFIVQKVDNEEYSKLEKLSKPVHVDTPSDEFIKIYGIFERYRFGLKNEKKVCNKCQCSRFYNVKNGQLKCAGCGYKMSLIARTYIGNMKLTYSKFYKLVTILSKDQNITSHFLAKRLSVTQKTAWHRKHLIISVMASIFNNKRCDVIYKILTCIDFDVKKVELIETGIRKFSPDDIFEIRRLRKDNVYKVKEIAEIYLTDTSTIYKIARRELYVDVA
jgi:hypothetical protein